MASIRSAASSSNTSWLIHPPLLGAPRKHGAAPGVRSGDLPQPAGLDLVDEPADRVLLRDERARLDPVDRLAHVLLEVLEGLGRPGRLDSRVLLDLTPELVVVEGQHAAVRVMDQDDFLGAEQPLGDRQRADLVVRHDPAGVPDHVSVAELEAQDRIGVHARVHARDDRDLLRGWYREPALVEPLGVLLCVLQELVCRAHFCASSGISKTLPGLWYFVPVTASRPLRSNGQRLDPWGALPRSGSASSSSPSA